MLALGHRNFLVIKFHIDKVLLPGIFTNLSHHFEDLNYVHMAEQLEITLVESKLYSPKYPSFLIFSMRR